MNALFAVHTLNEVGRSKAKQIAAKFDTLLSELLDMRIELNTGREVALVKTHLELASFFAKKAMAMQIENQLPGEIQPVKSLDERAEAAFNAYNEQGPNPWKTFDGRDVPRWPDLSEQVRAKWRAAVSI